MSGSRKYPERITIQTRAVARTTSGRPTETWTTQFTRRAEVIEGRSTEGPQNNQHQNSQDYMIKLPTDPAATILDPQTSRLIWASSAGNVTINLTGRSVVTAGRRPELVWTGTKDLN